MWQSCSVALAGLLVLCVAPAGASDGDEGATRLARELGAAVGAFAATLDEDQRGAALYDFDDDERFDLRLAPLWLEGLLLSEMSDAQWHALRGAFEQVLSPQGFWKMETIRSLEHEVGEMEGGLVRFLMRRYRGTKRYFLAVFGDPAPDAVWGLRFDGHHLSLNWTAVPDAPLSVTPLFLGGQPREVPAGFERTGLRVLAAEEDEGLALVRSLDAAQRATASRGVSS